MYFSSSVNLILYLAVRLKADVRLGLVLIHKRDEVVVVNGGSAPLLKLESNSNANVAESKFAAYTNTHKGKQIKQNAEVSLVSLYFCSKYTKEEKKHANTS